MGAPDTFLFLQEPDHLGTWLTARYSGLGRVPVHGLAHLEGRVETFPALGMDSFLLHLAVAAVQPNHALPVADLSTASDDGCLGRYRVLSL